MRRSNRAREQGIAWAGKTHVYDLRAASNRPVEADDNAEAGSIAAAEGPRAEDSRRWRHTQESAAGDYGAGHSRPMDV